ncbi:MAG: ribokinase [Anaerorhabdus sp.]
MKIVVVGSLNMDTTIVTKDLPKEGETVIAYDYYNSFGGKGANQAVSCSRLGCDVTMVGCVGEDVVGENYTNKLKQEKINVENIIKSPKATGNAIISVQSDGHNSIIVYPGANKDLTIEHIDKIWGSISKVDLIIVQFEIPLLVAKYVAKKAKESNIDIIVNPAPAFAIDSEFARNITYLTPNETELEFLSNEKNLEKGVQKLLDLGIKNVIVTLGKKGCSWYTKNEKIKCSGLKVNTIDTTAAGDCFNGAFATALGLFKNKKQILEFANKAAAISTLTKGAIGSLPYFKDVMEF